MRRASRRADKGMPPMSFEYKTVGAPEKARRKRGSGSRSDRVAAAVAEIIQTEAVDGWEYQRTDLLPVSESAGWFRRGQVVHRAVMVFRRPLGRVRPIDTAAAPEPEVSADPKLRIDDDVRAPGRPEPES